MTCPDWTLLARAGDEFLREESRERAAALAHAAECPSCRREALALDPSLAVSRLPVPAATRAEIDAIKHDLAGLRRLRDVEQAARPPRRWAGGRVASVAALTAAILLVAENTGNRSTEREAAALPDGPVQPLFSEDYRLYGSLPLVESLAPSEARVYQLGRDDFSLVWIVDESIEVEEPVEVDAPSR